MRGKINLIINILFAVSLILGISGKAVAANFQVTKTADTNDGACNADCSLREAIAAANSSAANDTIDFTLNLVGSTFTLTLGEIQLANNGTLSINGFGANALTVSGNNSSRIFYVPNSANVTISGLTLTGGNGVGTGSTSGGAIRSDHSTVVLDGVHITDNSFNVSGAGAFFGNLSIVTIRNSTFSNHSCNCSTLSLQASGVTIVNSTFYNIVSGHILIEMTGGGVALRNSTVTSQVAIGGMTSFSFGNSIINHFIRSTLSNGITSQGNNLVLDTSTVGSQPITYNASDILNAAPQYGTLQNNGGKTPTMALLAGSPAIDAGSTSLAMKYGLTTDQRGFARFADGNGDATATVDIGAYEYLAAPPQSVSISGRVFDASGSPVFKAFLVLTDSQGNERPAISNPFGYYGFQNVTANEVYRIEVISKNRTFANQFIQPSSNISNFDITAQ